MVAIEDRRFYFHPGIDPIGLGRAIVQDVRRGGKVEGGSTLTQQLARTLFLSNVRTYGRKLKEAGIALLIEAQLTKTQILELYLNRVYLSAGVYGVETMSEHMFRRPAKTLTLPEAALVAGLIRAPSTLSPWSNYDGAIERSHVVLARMREQGFITGQQEEAAKRARPRIQTFRQPSDSRAAWAKEYLRQQFRGEFGGDHPPDWQVHTGFVPSIQDAAERAVAAGLLRLNRPGLEAALVAIDPATGDLLAMVGGRDYSTSTFNRATRSKRQPGSAFKPLVYAAALSHGYSPVSVLSDLRTISAPDNPEWTPRNAHGEEPEAHHLACGIDGIEQRRRRGSAAARRRAHRAARRWRCRARWSARGGIARPRNRTRVSDRSDRGVHDVSRRRTSRAAARHRQRLRCRRRRGGRS